MTNTTKNLFPALSNMLKANKIALEKEEFKAVLDQINGKAEATIELSPIAKTVIDVFDMDDLDENQFYLVEQRASIIAETDGYQAVAKNRAQLLAILIAPGIINPDIHIMSFAKPFPF